MTEIARSVLDHPVQGLNLRGPTFGDQLEPGRPQLVAFLRHFG